MSDTATIQLGDSVHRAHRHHRRSRLHRIQLLRRWRCSRGTKSSSSTTSRRDTATTSLTVPRLRRGDDPRSLTRSTSVQRRRLSRPPRGLGECPRSIADPLASHAANATGTLLVLEAARRAGCGHVVAASSSSVYGLEPGAAQGRARVGPPDEPLRRHQAGDRAVRAGLPAVLRHRHPRVPLLQRLRPRQRAGHVYAAVIPIFVDALLRGEPLPVNGDGSNSRDFTYVGTVCRVLLDAVERRVIHPEPVNLAFGTNTTLLELIERIAATSGLDAGGRPPGAATRRRQALPGRQRRPAFALPRRRARISRPGPGRHPRVVQGDRREHQPRRHRPGLRRTAHGPASRRSGHVRRRPRHQPPRGRRPQRRALPHR